MNLIIIVFLLLSGCGGQAIQIEKTDQDRTVEQKEKDRWNDTGPSRMYDSSPLDVFTRPYSPWDPYQN